MIVCIDTNILIWGVRKESTEGQEDNIVFAEYFLKSLYKKGNSVIIPTPVIAELLSPIPNELRPKLLNKITELGISSSFDLGASLKYASLFNSVKKHEVQKFKTDSEKSRNAMKVDLMILAIALVNRCDVLYTNNIKDFTIWTKGQPIQILDMPKQSFEQDLEFPPK